MVKPSQQLVTKVVDFGVVKKKCVFDCTLQESRWSYDRATCTPFINFYYVITIKLHEDCNKTCKDIA